MLVLDEADRMLDMGFLPDMKRVFAQLPKQRQTLLFSATFSDEIRTLAATLMRNPVSVQATPRNSTVEAVDQKAISIERTRKSELLAHLIKDNQWFQVLVFTRTKHGANRLAEYLGKHGVTALAIHGNKSQNARTRALADFKRGDLQALVATDIAARGLDIEQLPHVVNFDLPNVPEDYVHRIGRTGRAGATGEAISLVSREEEALLRDIERLIKRPVPRMTVPSYQPSVGAAHDPDHRPARTAQPSRRPAAPKRAASQPQRESRRAPAAWQRWKGQVAGAAGASSRSRAPGHPVTRVARPPAANEATLLRSRGRHHAPPRRAADTAAVRVATRASRWCGLTYRGSCSPRRAAVARLRRPTTRGGHVRDDDFGPAQPGVTALRGDRRRHAVPDRLPHAR